MNNRQYKIICFNIILTLILVPFCPGQSLLDDEQLRNQHNNQHKDWIGTERINRHDVSFETATNGKDTSAAATDDPKSVKYVKETVKGLQSAGCALGKIVATLANNGNSAVTISMALLSTGDYSSQDIRNSLINDGKFSAAEADAAIPAKSTASIDGNLFKPETTPTQTTTEPAQAATAIQDKITEYQNKGYTLQEMVDALLNDGTSVKDIISSLHDAGYKYKKIIKALNAEEAAAKDVISALSDLGFKDTKIVNLMCKAGYSTESIVQGLKDLGKSLEEIVAAFKKKSGDVYTVRRCAELVSALIKVGYKAEDVAKAVHDAGGSWKKITRGLNQAGVTATDTLKILADNGVKDTKIVKLMLKAGYNTEGIVQGAKALGWDAGRIVSAFTVKKVDDSGNVTYKVRVQDTELVNALVKAGFQNTDIKQAFQDAKLTLSAEASKILEPQTATTTTETTNQTQAATQTQTATNTQTQPQTATNQTNNQPQIANQNQTTTEQNNTTEPQTTAPAPAVEPTPNTPQTEELPTPSLSPEERVKQGLAGITQQPTNKFKGIHLHLINGNEENNEVQINAKEEAKIVTEMLAEGYSIEQIAQGFADNDRSISQTAEIFKASGVSSEDTYKALSSVVISQADAMVAEQKPTAKFKVLHTNWEKSWEEEQAKSANQMKQDGLKEVVTAMTDAGYDIKPALNDIVKDLKATGMSATETYNFLIPSLAQEKPKTKFKGGLFFRFWQWNKNPTNTTYGEGEVKLAEAMMQAGYSNDEITKAFQNKVMFGDNASRWYSQYSYSNETISQILKQAQANLANAAV